MFAGVLATIVGPRVALGGMAFALVVIGILVIPYALPLLNKLTGDSSQAITLRRSGGGRRFAAAATGPSDSTER